MLTMYTLVECSYCYF